MFVFYSFDSHAASEVSTFGEVNPELQEAAVYMGAGLKVHIVLQSHMRSMFTANKAAMEKKLNTPPFHMRDPGVVHL